MRIFDHPNLNGFWCPICGTSKDAPVVLVGMAGTEEGHVMQATQVHVECLDLYMYLDLDFKGGNTGGIAMAFEVKPSWLKARKAFKEAGGGND